MNSINLKDLTIVFLDKEDFSFQDIVSRPMAGAHTAFVELVKSMAGLGCSVKVRNYCKQEYIDNAIEWRALVFSEIPKGDIYIVNRSTSLLALVPKGKRTIFWMHNDCKYLLRPSNIKQLLIRYPTLVFSGKYHRSTFLFWFLFRNRIIPYGIASLFCAERNSKIIPRPKVIFTSNPLRSLDWLVDRWKTIHAKVPDAELHIFSGPSTYGTWGDSVASRMNKVLDYVRAHKQYGIVLRDPLPKSQLINELKSSRAMLYRGDRAETFCLAIAEAQALGVPCVVQNLGSMKERVVDQITGFVTKTNKEFIIKSVALLTDNTLWMKQHEQLVKGHYHKTWEQVALMFINDDKFY